MNQHCCEEMNLHLRAGEVAIVYLPEFREYGLKILDGGSSFQEIYYCPWCGQKLPESLRSRWFELMAELGLEWDDERVPPKYLSEAWWREEADDSTARAEVRFGARENGIARISGLL